MPSRSVNAPEPARPHPPVWRFRSGTAPARPQIWRSSTACGQGRVIPGRVGSGDVKRAGASPALRARSSDGRKPISQAPWVLAFGHTPTRPLLARPVCWLPWTSSVGAGLRQRAGAEPIPSLRCRRRSPRSRPGECFSARLPSQASRSGMRERSFFAVWIADDLCWHTGPGGWGARWPRSASRRVSPPA